MIVCQAFDHGVQGDQTGRRDDTGLAQATADHTPENAGAGDEFA